MKRTPMKRSVPPGFEGLNVKMMDVELPPAPRAYRPSSYAGTTTGIAMPKEPRIENSHLLLMARNQPRPCLLVVPGLCVSLGRETSCCACHGNSHVWNKGGGMKAHDFFSVWGCARCHNWLDSSYTASGEERDLAFRRALALQIIHWDVIATDPAGKPKDIEAASWALQCLIERGFAIASPHAGQFATPDIKALHARQP